MQQHAPHCRPIHPYLLTFSFHVPCLIPALSSVSVYVMYNSSSFFRPFFLVILFSFFVCFIEEAARIVMP